LINSSLRQAQDDAVEIIAMNAMKGTMAKRAQEASKDMSNIPGVGKQF
jgi:hypothetical protein